MAKKKGEITINHNYCKTCGICVSFCPVQDLEIHRGKLTELGKCIACRLCEIYCPDMAITVEVEDGKATLTGKSSNSSGG
ncbi:MAG: 4Fe-4S binding protein [Candidatus Brocadiales bacterium]